MRFYRVSHKTLTYGNHFVGPYIVELPEFGYEPESVDAIENGLHDAHTWANGHPGLRSEFGLWCEELAAPWLSGFGSMEKLHHWFEGFHEHLAATGFVVRVYEVEEEHTQHGRVQSITLSEFLGSELETHELNTPVAV